MASKRLLSDPPHEDLPISKKPRPTPPDTPTFALPPPDAPPPPPAPFQQPLPLLTFSYTPAHELEFSDAALRYFVEPPRGADLGHAFERWARRFDERGRIDSLVAAWARARTAGGAGAQAPIGLVAWRGVVTRILTAPHEARDGWALNVMCVRGTIYLEEHYTSARVAEQHAMKPQQLRQMYYGYAFEAYCTAEEPGPKRKPPAPGDPQGWGGDVNNNVQWCCVVKTKLGDTRMVLGGEVDCVRGEYKGSTDTFVELKTSMAIRHAQDEARFEKKLLKFYFQSFLLGVPEIVVGFRTGGGRITTTQSFKTVEIPRLVRGKPEAWDPSVCLDWGARFLAFLRECVQDGDAKTVWRATFVPRKGVRVAALDAAEVADVVNGEDRIGFLPRAYWEAEAGRT